jgi:hypothetical protein
MTYVKPHMPTVLDKHQLENVSPGVWRMRRPDSMDYRVLLTFNEEGIVIQGDIGLGDAQNGICSRGGYGIDWFGKPLSEDYLCSKFLSKRWQLEAAKEDLDRWVQDATNELARTRLEGDPDCIEDARKTLENWKKLRGTVGDETTEAELYDAGSDLFTDFWDYGVGMDYPLADAGWLCVIQQRFTALYQGRNQTLDLDPT